MNHPENGRNENQRGNQHFFTEERIGTNEEAANKSRRKVESLQKTRTDESCESDVMEELTGFLVKNGFDFVPSRLDGDYQEFEDSEGSGWYVGSLYKLPSGKYALSFTVRRWHEEKNAQKHFRSSSQLNEEDAREFASLENRAKEEKEKIDDLAEHRAAQNAETIWRNAATRSPSPDSDLYFKAKEICAPLGCRFENQNGGNLFVPCVDLNDGKLWGLQTILPSGEKKFLRGQRSKGTCHVIGDLKSAKTVYVVEGFATGASIYSIMNSPVVVAFYASNLTDVAQKVIGLYPNAKIVIAGDDDVHSTGNRGRKSAEEAAKVVGGIAAFPRFKKYAGKATTDWNDLHRIDGADAVKSQLAAIQSRSDEPTDSAPAREFVQALGFNGGSYFYTTSSNKQNNMLTSHGPEALLKLMPLSYWERHFSRSGKMVKDDWQRAASTLMDDCRRVGMFHPRRIRGRGVHMDSGRVVVHLGDRLNVDGEEQELRNLPNSPFIYEYSMPLNPIDAKPFSTDDLKDFVTLIGKLRFAHPEQGYFLGGWIATALICGALHWRPHLWLTGQQGAGKSTVLNKLVKPILRVVDCIEAQGGSTEAGIRQDLRSDALPIVFDEFESTSQRADNRVENLLELMRQASSEDGGHIIKGSVSGAAQKYFARFSAIVSAITPKLVNAQDRARFTLVELQKEMGEGDSNVAWKELCRLFETIDGRFGARLFARMVRLTPTVMENQKRLQSACAEKHSQRFGQQYGTLLAGWAALTSDGVLSAGEVAELVGKISVEQEVSSNSESEHEACLLHLLEKQVTVPNGRSSVMQILKRHQGDENGKAWVTAANDQLESLGLFLVNRRKENMPMLFVSGDGHPELRNLFKDSKWGTLGWRATLARLPGAESYQVERGRKKLPRGVLIPMEGILEAWNLGDDPA